MEHLMATHYRAKSYVSCFRKKKINKKDFFLSKSMSNFNFASSLIFIKERENG
jgi:hypothetical protein